MKNTDSQESSVCNIDPIWQLSDSFTVQQAAALIAGCDPTYVIFASSGGPVGIREEANAGTERIVEKLQATFKVLTNAIDSRILPAIIGYSARDFGVIRDILDQYRSMGIGKSAADYLEAGERICSEGLCAYMPHPDWSLTKVSRQDVSEWLQNRGFRVSFFSPAHVTGQSYLDPKHPRYSAKLAAAVEVWMALEESEASVKPARVQIQEWLDERYEQLNLVWDGKKSDNAIRQIVDVVNWNVRGGSTKTPG